MKEKELKLILPLVSEYAAEAGKRIVEIYHTGFDVLQKSDKTPVTNADIAADSFLCEVLSKLTPDIPILSEESESAVYEVRRSWETYWLVDPLDGTKHFLKGKEDFTVNIALLEKSEPVLGVIYMPARQKLYCACKGSGAYKQAKGGAKKEIKTRLQDSSKPPLVLTSYGAPGATMQNFLNRLVNYEMNQIGSSIKSCMVAEGSADIYPCFSTTAEWDIAAAQCIVEEAGGTVVDINFTKLRYNKKDSLINPKLLVIGDSQYEWSSYF